MFLAAAKAGFPRQLATSLKGGTCHGFSLLLLLSILPGAGNRADDPCDCLRIAGLVRRSGHRLSWARPIADGRPDSRPLGAPQSRQQMTLAW